MFIGKAPAVSVNYIDGETRIAPIDANDAITLNILVGTATQSGVVSGDAAVYKTGQGTLTLSANNTYRGTTNVEDGTLVLTGHSASAAFNIVSGAVLELVPAANYTASTVFSGNGTLRKSGSVSARWAEAGATFALESGSLIDVQAGTFVGGANANEDWTSNKSDLHVAEGAIFNGVEANVRVNVLTGSGIIRSGYSGAIYEAFTFGVDNGSGTFAGVLADNPGEVGRYVKTGSGTQILTGTNTHTGLMTVSGGTLQIGNGGTTGSLVGNIANQGALVFNRSDDVTYGAVISGSGTFTKQGAGTVALTGASTYTGLTTINEGTLQLGDGGATGSITGDVVNNATLAFNRTGDFTYAGAISGTGQVVNRGAGRVTLTGDNAYSGGTTFAAGTVMVDSAGALGSSGLLSFTGGTLQFGAANTTDYSARFSNAPNQQYRVDTGEQNVTFAGDLTSPGGTLSKLGTGRLTLKGENTYGGGTTFAAGTVMVDSAGALGSSGLLSFTGGTLQFGAANTTDYSARFSNAPNQQYRIDTGGQNVTFAGNLTSAGGTLSKAGGGTLTLTGANTYAGGTTISAGTLQIGDDGTSGSVLGNITNMGALAFNRSDSVAYTGAISGSGTLTKLGAGMLTFTHAHTYSGPTTVSAGTLRLQNSIYSQGTIAGVVTVGSGGTLDLRAQDIFGNHTDNSNVRVTIEAGGLVTNGNFFNTFADLTLNGGELRAGGGEGEIWPAFQLKGTVSTGGSSASSITTTGASNSRIQIGNNNAGGFTTFDVADATGSGAADLTISAVLQNGRDSEASFVASGLMKTGEGTLRLTGTNTYTGATTIEAGTLVVDGSIADSSLTTIGASGKLAGSGTVGAVAILDGGTISPGNSPGILNTGSETWNGGGSYVWELNSATGDAGTNWDLLNITGTLALDGLDAGNPFTIIVTSLDAADHAGVAENFDPAQSYTWTLVTASSGITGFGVGNFAIDTSGFANAPNSTRFSLSTDGNHLVLSYSAVPEPGAYGVALGIGLALLAIAGRRRK